MPLLVEDYDFDQYYVDGPFMEQQSLSASATSQQQADIFLMAASSSPSSSSKTDETFASSVEMMHPTSADNAQTSNAETAHPHQQQSTRQHREL